MRENLARAGVDVAQVHAVCATATGIAYVMGDSSSENSIVVARGANRLLSGAEVQCALEDLSLAADDVLLTSTEIPDEAVNAAGQAAEASGATHVHNLSPSGASDTFPAPAVEVVYSTGAGDALAGVLAAELATGSTLAEATTLAVSGASHAVQHAAARAGLVERSGLAG